MDRVTMKFHLLREVVVVVHTKAAPSDAEWSRYLDFMRSYPGDFMRLRTLVWSAGGGPSSKKHRDELREMFAGRRHRSAVVMTSMVSRMVMTAVTWVHPDLKFFAPADLALALDYLAVGEELRPEILAALQSVQNDLAKAAA